MQFFCGGKEQLHIPFCARKENNEKNPYQLHISILWRIDNLEKATIPFSSKFLTLIFGYSNSN